MTKTAHLEANQHGGVIAFAVLNLGRRIVVLCTEL